ncbi:hypothetical protein [Mycobacterium shigaense]|uniref:Uncharacterized protein n=1 Tax=Mycobacterium shigaense TaxID=722731 RepID=A0A1Z4EBS5_9MYCO|nr:hypothetical protein [Mycobacterium shigaense]MEA1121263.1 hypothetical protein [Mycobacterium shigaense]PRI15399.1 hypothetical protein B2J96_13610 [Mycobacterium shigaense]BAX90409.1 hypothetical protein MSG_00243 [Mycobacterium shigaense]
MHSAQKPVAGRAVVAIVMAAAAAAGCANSGKAPSSTPAPLPGPGAMTGPSPAQATDYSGLLIKPNDLGADFVAAQPPVLNPNNTSGVSQFFINADKSRRVGDSIQIVADPATAVVGVDNTKTNYGGKVSGAWQPVDVGSNGVIISGVSPDNSQSMTVLLFTEGRALVDLEFDGAPDDPIDPAVATDIGRKQDAAIKSGLHS